MMSIFQRVSRVARAAILGGVTLGASLGVGGLAPAHGATLIGQEFQHANYGGAVLNYWMPNGWTCTTSTTNVDAAVASMPGGWNDIISSYKNFANCWTKHFEHNNWGGASVGYSNDSAYIGNAMNDRTSSIRWS